MMRVVVLILALATAPEVQGDVVTVIRTCESGLPGIHAGNAAVHLSVGTDPDLPDERVLLVDHPVPGSDRAACDVRCDAERSDWTGGRAISFQIKPSHDQTPISSLPERSSAARLIDISDVKSIAFAPQDGVAGRLAISRFVVLK